MLKRFRNSVSGKLIRKDEALRDPDHSVSETVNNHGRIIRLANEVVNSAGFDQKGRTDVSTKDLDALHDELRKLRA